MDLVNPQVLAALVAGVVLGKCVLPGNDRINTTIRLDEKIVKDQVCLFLRFVHGPPVERFRALQQPALTPRAFLQVPIKDIEQLAASKGKEAISFCRCWKSKSWPYCGD